MATARLMSINELKGTFFIPAYQRGYRWTEEQVRQLLNDLFQFSNHHGEGEFYCLQPIIVKKRNENEWEVVDGQQRLTLLWLLKDISHIIDGVQNEIQYKLTLTKEVSWIVFSTRNLHLVTRKKRRQVS